MTGDHCNQCVVWKCPFGVAKPMKGSPVPCAAQGGEQFPPIPGEAGALDFYGPGFGLPGVVSPVGSYWFFGPGERPGEVVVTLGVPADSLRRLFDSVETVASVGHPWAVEEEREVGINVGTGARATLQEIWPSLEGRN